MIELEKAEEEATINQEITKTITVSLETDEKEEFRFTVIVTYRRLHGVAKLHNIFTSKHEIGLREVDVTEFERPGKAAAETYEEIASLLRRYICNVYN